MKRNAAFIAVTAAALCATSCRERASSEDRVASAPVEDSLTSASAAGPLTALLDSGNAAFRGHDYERARDFYIRATQLDSTFAAGWFGVYMAEDKLGNAATAAYAMERAQGKR